MSTIIATSNPSFSTSIPLFTQVIHILRHANVRYDQIARQYRRDQHPMHHAKRRAYRAGLWIDTSKARDGIYRLAQAADVLPNDRNHDHDHIDSTRMPVPVRHPAAYIPEWIDGSLDLPLSPLGLELRGIDTANRDANATMDTRHAPVPGAPRLRLRQLPKLEDEFAGGVVEATTSESPVSFSSCRDKAVEATKLDHVYLGITM